MKKGVCFFVLVNLLLIMVLSACASELSPPHIEKMPDVGIPEESLNQKIAVFAPKGWNTFKTKDSIGLVVRAISSEKISFKPIDIRTFLFDNGNWIEVQDQMVSMNPDFENILDPTQGNVLDQDGSTSILPKLPDPNKSATLRVFAFGFIYENGVKTEKKVAAFVDVTLTP